MKHKEKYIKHRKLFALSTFLILWFVSSGLWWGYKYDGVAKAYLSIPMQIEGISEDYLNQLQQKEEYMVIRNKSGRIELYLKKPVYYTLPEWLPPTIGMGLLNTLIYVGLGLIGLLFLYNMYFAICGIFKMKNKLQFIIYDGIAFSSVFFIILSIMEEIQY